MSLFLPTYVKPPVLTPLQYGLMSTVQMPIDEDRIHWRNGVQYQPHACDPAQSTLAQCPVVTGFAKDPTTVGVQARGSQAFTVYATIPCTPVGHFWEEAEERVTTALTYGENRALEKVFWTGTTDIPSGGTVYPHLAANANVFDSTGDVQLQMAANVVTGAPVDIVEGLGLLESAIATCYGGVGVIHATRATLSHMAAWHLIEKVGQQIRTKGGVPIAFGAGYPGTAPDGSTPAVGTAWMYATGAIFLRRSDIFITSNRIQGLNRSVNTLQLFAERTYTLGWDCCLFGLPVSLGGVITGTAGSAT